MNAGGCAGRRLVAVRGTPARDTDAGRRNGAAQPMGERYLKRSGARSPDPPRANYGRHPARGAASREDEGMSCEASRPWVGLGPGEACPGGAARRGASRTRRAAKSHERRRGGEPSPPRREPSPGCQLPLLPVTERPGVRGERLRGARRPGAVTGRRRRSGRRGRSGRRCGSRGSRGTGPARGRGKALRCGWNWWGAVAAMGVGCGGAAGCSRRAHPRGATRLRG